MIWIVPRRRRARTTAVEPSAGRNCGSRGRFVGRQQPLSTKVFSVVRRMWPARPVQVKWTTWLSCRFLPHARG